MFFVKVIVTFKRNFTKKENTSILNKKRENSIPKLYNRLNEYSFDLN